MRTIAHISDLHFGRTDPAIVEALAADLISQPPSVMVISGDLTQRARPWQYREARQFLDRLPKPQIVVPGNHDIPLYDVIRRFGFTFKRYTDHITADLAPVYRDEDLFVMGLNTARPFSLRLGGFWKDGKISMEELTRLRQQTEHLPAGVFRVVVTHHPFVPPSEHYRGDVVHGAAAALPVLRQCGIDLLLAGHLHMGYCDDVRVHHAAADCSILSVQAGTGTSTRRREPKNTYNRIVVDRDGVVIEVRGFDGSAFGMMETKQFVRSTGSGSVRGRQTGTGHPGKGFVMRAVMMVVVVAGLVALTLAAGGPAPQGGQLATPNDTKAFTDRFLTTLQNSRPFDAYQLVRAAVNDPQMDVDAMRATAEQTLTNARNSFGRTIGYELISTKNLGASFIRYDYLFRLETSALHFQITFYRGRDRYIPVDLYFEQELEELFFNLGK